MESQTQPTQEQAGAAEAPQQLPVQHDISSGVIQASRASQIGGQVRSQQAKADMQDPPSQLPQARQRRTAAVQTAPRSVDITSQELPGHPAISSAADMQVCADFAVCHMSDISWFIKLQFGPVKSTTSQAALPNKIQAVHAVLSE